MAFIEMTGATLQRIVKDDELHQGDLEATGVNDHTIVRVNQQGDIEVRRKNGWDVIGGLLGDFAARVRRLRPELGMPTLSITEAYLRLRYGPAPAAGDLQLLQGMIARFRP